MKTDKPRTIKDSIGLNRPAIIPRPESGPESEGGQARVALAKANAILAKAKELLAEVQVAKALAYPIGAHDSTAPRVSAWSEEPPKLAGFYWVVRRGYEHDTPIFATVAYVTLHTDGSAWVFDGRKGQDQSGGYLFGSQVVLPPELVVTQFH